MGKHNAVKVTPAEANRNPGEDNETILIHAAPAKFNPSINKVYRWKVGHVRRGEVGRKDYGGAEIPGPWAYGFELCTVIDNHGGTGREMDDASKAGRVVEIDAGDFLEIAGNVYRVELDNQKYLSLRLIV